MKDIHVVSIVGPKDGKPQKGNATWLTFSHSDEKRARQLGEMMARRLSERTGFPMCYHVEPTAMVTGDELRLLREIDEVADRYEPAPAAERGIVIATFSGDDAPALGASDLADRLIEGIRTDHGIDLDDWLIVSEEPAGCDADEAGVAISLPIDDVQWLMRSKTIVDRYGLRASDAEHVGSLYDDDARMEEIISDAEDAALHAWGGVGGRMRRANPHPDGSEEADLWDRTYANAYARENGR